jgi:hypothetical protein
MRTWKSVVMKKAVGWRVEQSAHPTAAGCLSCTAYGVPAGGLLDLLVSVEGIAARCIHQGPVGR